MRVCPGPHNQVSLICLNQNSQGTWKASETGHAPRKQGTIFLPSLVQCLGWDKRPNSPGPETKALFSSVFFFFPVLHSTSAKLGPDSPPWMQRKHRDKHSNHICFSGQEFPGRFISPESPLSYASPGTHMDFSMPRRKWLTKHFLFGRPPLNTRCELHPLTFSSAMRSSSNSHLKMLRHEAAKEPLFRVRAVDFKIHILILQL